MLLSIPHLDSNHENSISHLREKLTSQLISFLNETDYLTDGEKSDVVKDILEKKNALGQILNFTSPTPAFYGPTTSLKQLLGYLHELQTQEKQAKPD